MPKHAPNVPKGTPSDRSDERIGLTEAFSPVGDGAHAEDGIYVLLKEVIDNSIDEFKMQAGKKIEIIVEENLRVSVRDYGRGIPQGKLIEAVSMLNTGGKYDSKAFKKSVGLNEPSGK